MSASTSRSPACSPRAWWCTRPTSKQNGEWVTPAEVKIEGAEGGARSATLAATGEPIEIGGIEKMSKSKKNTVDPDDIMATYGADTARWFMLSDSPPERDVEWTERGVQGAWRFVQRLWRLVGEARRDRQVRAGRARPPVVRRAGARACARPRMARSPRCPTRSRSCTSTSASRTSTSSPMRSARRSAKPAATPDFAWAMREAADILVRLFHPMMPHLAEECWAALGHDTLVADEPWPEVEPALLVENTITLPVQINGKKRADVTVARDATNAEIEAAVLALDAVQRALDGKRPKKVIVVPQRIVNVVA